ncbi:MAG: bifunctional glutamate N-acetyltransferase/amino-acid acetyltransferase ArgJ [Candidatus Caldatribacteriaceae bacterium]
MGKKLFLAIEGGLDTVLGFSSRGICCGIKKEKNDLAVILSEIPATSAGVFTQNVVKAAPVLLTSTHLKAVGKTQLVVINSGVANACTGERGREDALRMARMGALCFGIPDERLVAVASTGVIGEFLPLDKIEQGLWRLRELLPQQKSGIETARAIMTTDTFPKERAVAFSVGGRVAHLAGIAKGSGMIRPKLATMLSFLLTDVAVERESLQKVLREAVEVSFNRITVDGDTSTNDMVLILANGQSGSPILREGSKDFAVFREALFFVCGELAKDLARDGEGATKLVEILVRGARSEREAERCAFAVAESPLVKTAFFGEDPNWGRIMAALGRSGVIVNPESVDITINGTPFARGGMKVPGMDRSVLQKAMKGKELRVVIDLHSGNAESIVWTCDLSFDYVRINSHYS